MENLSLPDFLLNKNKRICYFFLNVSILMNTIVEDAIKQQQKNDRKPDLNLTFFIYLFH